MDNIITDKGFENLLPPLHEEEFKELEKDIVQKGCLQPLVIWGGILIDGYHRYRICQKHNIPFSVKELEFNSRYEALFWAWSQQKNRRNLTKYDLSKAALRFKPAIEERALENQRNSLKQYGSVCHNSDERIDTKKEIAKIAGVSHDTIHRVEVIETKAPEFIKEKLKKGEMSINQAYNAVRKEEKIKKVEEKIKENRKAPRDGFVDIYNTDRKFNIIYADPPWKYWTSGQKNASNHYKCMCIDELCEVPVKSIADNNCILFLWVTYPILQECFKVIEAWGFKYSTCGFAWFKENRKSGSFFIGCGSWTRANSELCLIATKGHVERLDASISQVIHTPVQEHSRKPHETYGKIARLVGELPRIELFARRTEPGWSCWGNEL